jgi:hypothetical protein
MSYDIELIDPVTGETCELGEPHQMRGGTYCLGGTREAAFNITYNYFDILDRVLPAREPDSDNKEYARDDGKLHSIRAIYGLTGAESIPILKAAIAQLGDDVDDNYWKATEGNVKRALNCVLALAQMRPDGVWSGD